MSGLRPCATISGIAGCSPGNQSAGPNPSFTWVRVNSYATVENAVILPYVDIGRSARLTNVVVDRGVQIPPGLIVGEDPALDARRFRRTDQGVCLITQPMIDRLSQ